MGQGCKSWYGSACQVQTAKEGGPVDANKEHAARREHSQASYGAQYLESSEEEEVEQYDFLCKI